MGACTSLDVSGHEFSRVRHAGDRARLSRPAQESQRAALEDLHAIIKAS